MMNFLCDYGCGQEALFQFKNEKWCCSRFSNSCPAMIEKNRESNKGTHHYTLESFDNQTVLCKYGCGKVARYLVGQGKEKNPCCSKFYCQCEEVREKNRKKNVGLIRKRGPESKLFGRKKPEHSQLMQKKNPMFNSYYKQKVIDITSTEEYKISMSEKIEKMWRDNPGIKEIVSQKSRQRWRNRDFRERIFQTWIKNGLKTPDEKLSELDLYYRKVEQYTKESIRDFYHIINPENKLIGRKKQLYSIDHKYSKIIGFREDIDPKIIGSYINLETITFSSNSSKKRKCSITKEELIKEYEQLYESNL